MQTHTIQQRMRTLCWLLVAFALCYATVVMLAKADCAANAGDVEHRYTWSRGCEMVQHGEWQHYMPRTHTEHTGRTP